jgi:uncharacterized surface protein with fasciclin (FAS1) repeats/outer membrane protein OmpA-like peptidoglycan-associated protein
MQSDGGANIRRTSTTSSATTTHHVRKREYERNPKPWLLLPLAGAMLLGSSLATHRVEDDLEKKTAAALGLTAEDSVDFRGRTGFVCVADNELAAARAKADDIRGVKKIELSSDSSCAPSGGLVDPDTPPVTQPPAPVTNPPVVTEPKPTDPPATPGPTDPPATPGPTEPQALDIVATAAKAGTFKTLGGLLDSADLTATLQGEGPFTVFAPTDEAFAKLDPARLKAIQDDEALLAKVLTYHVIPGAVKAADLTTGPLKTIDGREVSIIAADGVVTVNADRENARVSTPDIAATNGLIHVIDSVLLPPDIDVPTAEAATKLRMDATYDGVRLNLTGVVDNDAQRQAIYAGAVAAMGGDASKVVDSMTIANTPDGPSVSASTDKANRLAALLAALPPNFSLASAGVDSDLYLKGNYLNDEAKARAEAAAATAGVPAGAITIEPVPVATEADKTKLLADLNALFVNKTIQFSRGKADILPESTPLLDDAAAKLRQFDLTGIQITIEGHTDADGSDAANLALSQRRAEAVKLALVERGIAAAVLVPQGFGESRPVADNATVEGKARNRRVQFSAKQ